MSLNFCGQCGGRMVEGANPGFSGSFLGAKFDTVTGAPLREPTTFLRCENDPLRSKYASDNRHTVGYVPADIVLLPPADPDLMGILTKPPSLGRWLRKVIGHE